MTRDVRTRPGAPRHVEHFEDLARQAHAAKLGMWIFLATEVLFFGALFAVYGAERIESPHVFSEGIHHGKKWIGTINTYLLLSSSFTLALAYDVLKKGRRRSAAALTALTVALGLAFLALKLYEYHLHVVEGFLPAGYGARLADKRQAIFWTLYYGMTGLHAAHVAIGACVLGVLADRVWLGHFDPPHTHPFEIGTMYWHFVDIVWFFLWPLFYLTSSAGSSGGGS